MKKLDTDKEEIKCNFYFILCDDVLIQILHSATRHQLCLVETIGKRFLWLIDGCYKEAPFLRLHVFIKPL